MSRIEDVREEILRKRRAGKLPGDTTSVLKNWWQQHAKWPYPTVSDHLIFLHLTLFQYFHNLFYVSLKPILIAAMHVYTTTFLC